MRTNAIVVLALAILVLTFFFLGAGNYGAHITLIHWGGYFGRAAAACAVYRALRSSARTHMAGLCSLSGH